MASEKFMLIAYIVGVLTALFGLLLLNSKLRDWVKMVLIAVGSVMATVAAFLYET